MDYFLEWSFAIFIKKIGYIFGWFDFYLYFCGVTKRPLSIYRYGDSLVFFKFEIVFSSLYKFCEGMFRRETVHSHLFPFFSSFRTPSCAVPLTGSLPVCSARGLSG